MSSAVSMGVASRNNVVPSREILGNGPGCPNVPAAKAVPPPPAAAAADANLLYTRDCRYHVSQSFVCVDRGGGGVG